MDFHFFNVVSPLYRSWLEHTLSKRKVACSNHASGSFQFLFIFAKTGIRFDTMAIMIHVLCINNNNNFQK